MIQKLLLPLVVVGVLGFLYNFNRMLFTFVLPLGAIGLVSVIYFWNNPVGHSAAFRRRCYFNWLTLGLTYACLYMGRYNLTAAKTAMGDDVMSKADFGMIFGIGAVVYGCSFLVNGPLTDKLGGRKTIIIGALGAAVCNLLLGYFTYTSINAEAGAAISLFIPFVIIYAVNMYFQSFGAVSIVKVNASWFHIKERGVFGGIFGTLISLGIFLAFDLIKMLLKVTTTAEGQVQFWYAFFIPAGVLAFWALMSFLFVQDSPGKAGFDDFNTGDAGSDDAADVAPVSTKELYTKLLSHPVIQMMIAIEFCSGVLRNGIMHWGKQYAKDIGVVGTDLFFVNWGLVLMVAGITGGFFAGFISDKLFQSRRGPSAFFLYAGMFAGFVVMIAALMFKWNAIVGFLCFFMSMCVIGVHGMLSGTASMDFGGKKAAATTAGVIDGFVYLGTGFQSIALGYIIPKFGWKAWPVFLIPFTVIGLFFTWKIWNAFPDAKGKKGH